MSNPQAKTATIPNHQPPVIDDQRQPCNGDEASNALACVSAHLPQLGQATGAIEGLNTMLQRSRMANESRTTDLRTLNGTETGTLHDALACCALFASHLVDSIGDCIAAAEGVRA